ncbi:MAG TPA: UDP-N-acetylmuramate dehydrogenase [Steroidobacteraceae bacterium]|nr:UDP-N-acetylmuramate dehydrogenase [Steroidobacteraceae bacterium]
MIPYTIREHVSLADRNTFGVEATAAVLAEVHDADALGEVLALDRCADLPVLVLGEGSNILVTADWPGLVITLALDAVEQVESDESRALLRVGAGVGWDALVDWTLVHGLEGLENLALIPGLAGAAPIQNIGAYGVEIREYIDAVTAWDRRAQQFVRFTNPECEFSYRESRFKRDPDRWIVTSLDLELPRHHELQLEYSGVRAELATLGIERPTARDVATAVRRLRRRKLPDPARIGNAGSFFKNPVVARDRFAALRDRYPEMPAFPLDDAAAAKLSAGWLIEACGLKGLRVGDAGVSAQHALVLVNHGRATGAEILAVAQQVIDTVVERFGIVLEPEPRIVGATISR